VSALFVPDFLILALNRGSQKASFINPLKQIQIMKKFIILPLIVLFCSLSTMVNAATITLVPLSNITGTADIDANNNVTLSIDGSYITQIIYFSDVPYPRYWYESVPNLGYYVFNSQQAHTLVVNYYNYVTAQYGTANYLITY
jgi:hypothetical protein